MNQPETASVICLCHNQASFVLESLDSVLKQSFKAIELIVVDDGSTDGSKEIIRTFLEVNKNVRFVDIADSVGNCAAFNRGFEISNGEFIIDLAADDILMPDRVEVGIERLNATGAGVHFSNAEIISETGIFKGYHNDRFSINIPEGNLYSHLVREYLICPPTMMIRREVLNQLGGYDESLLYEDFDFWVRSARDFDYCYSDQVLVKKREVKKSHSSSQERFRNDHQASTLKVCEKILEMNRTQEEGRALKIRCWHEIRQCIKKGNLSLISSYLSILKKLNRIIYPL